MKYLAFTYLTILLLTNCKSTNNQEKPIQNPYQQENTALSYSSDVNYQLWSKGVDYHAFGENPDWILDIDFDNVAYLQLDGKQHKFSIDNLYIKEEENKVQYMAFTSDSGLMLEILNMACEPGTTNIKRYSSTIQVMDKQGKSIEVTGCGNYIPNYGLNDIYVLDSVPGFEFVPGSFTQGMPYLELHVREMKFMGHDGCNNISGTFINELDRLEFGNFITTKMFCSTNPQFDFLTELAKVRSFEHRKPRLIFLDEYGQVVLTLKKVD
ncbi:MAG TPA: hypothetical protein DDX92_01545 [Flavobacteriales bacterium]|jgi:heat shock protein HslJ|nr:hypothetical protein [Flavobacteriales bacterium]